MRRRIASLIGAALTVLAAVAALVIIAAERVVNWRLRFRSRERAADLRRKVRQARAAAAAQRADLEARIRRDEEARRVE